jgi:hypothetical protein
METSAETYNEVIVKQVIDAEDGIYDGERNEHALEALLDDCLDIEVHMVHGMRSSRTDRIELLRSYGGPTTRISMELMGLHGYVTVRTVLGDERAARLVYAPGLFAILDEAAGYVLDAAKDRDDA